ncbi:MAG: recombinase family protein [Pseudomonadota bacterium]
MTNVNILIPDQILAEIERGTYRNKYLIYNRKSTDEAENQKNSLAFQSAENAKFSDREKLEIAKLSINGFCSSGVISEKHSGYKETDDVILTEDGMVQYSIDRPKFQKLMMLLHQGYFKGVICLCWDRISRNKGDDTILRKLMRSGVDVRFVYSNYDQSSSGELHMDIDGMFAQHHSRVTSEKVRLANRLKRSQGKCTYRAPIGYLNEGSADHKPQDPDRAPIIKELFELYATGEWSLPDLERHANKQGLRTVPKRPKRTKAEMLADVTENDNQREKISTPLRTGRIGRILRDPFYMGLVIGPDGLHIPSTCHEPLVSKETFDLVQALLASRRVSKYYEKKALQPFRGFIRCAKCRRAYTPYVKKGIVYYSAKCLPTCKNKRRNCNYDFVESKISALLARLVLSDEETEMLDAQASTELALLEERRLREQSSREREMATIREDLAYLRVHQLDLLKSGAYSPEALSKERDNLENRLDKLADKAAWSEASMRALVEDVVKSSELLKNVARLYELAKPLEKDNFLKKVCSELLLDEKTAQLSPKVGLEPVFRLKNLLGAQPTWFSERENHGLLEFLKEFQISSEHD